MPSLVVAAQLRIEPALEVFPVDALRRRPGHFGERRDAREGHVVDARLGAHHLGPEVGLHAEDVFALLLGDGRRHGLESVNHLQRQRVAAARRQVARALPVIQVQIRRRREHGVVAGLGRGDGAVDAAPRHDGRVGRNAALEDFIPADDAAAFRLDELGHALDEVALQVMRVGDAELLHARLDARRLLPLRLDRFVAADVDVLAGEDVDDFGQHVFEELERGLLDVEEILVHAPVGGHFLEWRSRCNAQLRIRDDGRAGVARHFDFRDRP